MSSTFADLKSKRSQAINVLKGELTKTQKQTNHQEDDRFWQPKVDAAGNGYAVIRFLPASKGEEIPWVRYWDHGFQGPGGWYIENSLTSIGEKDPVSEYNSKLWNEKKEDEARKQKRRLHYICNIMVIKDPANPENEGKIFLYKFGKKIFDKINEMMNPQFEHEEAKNPFDFWTGSNFVLKIRNVMNYRNYDSSQFEASTPVAGGKDEAIQAIWEKQYGLQDFLSPSKFKSYNELKDRLDIVLGLKEKSVSKKGSTYNDEERPAADASFKAAAPPAEESDEEDENFFKSFADEED